MVQHQIVIIGSGLGGLLTAVFLAKEGYDVAILEQNKQVGGCLQTFSFDKKVFDSAVHYIGALGDGEVLHRIFDYAGIMSRLKLKQLDKDCFDQVLLEQEGRAFRLGQGKAGYKESLLAQFPGEKEAISKYCDFLEKTARAYPLYNLRFGNGTEKLPYEQLSLSAVLEDTGASPLLQSVITGNSILYAGDRRYTSWATHVLVSRSYIDSSWRCDGGASQISKYLWKELQAHGGTIYRHEKVNKLQYENGKITAAHCASGNIFYADQFIANIHPKATLALVEAETAFKKVYRNRVNTARESVACMMVNIVLAPGKVAYKNYNVNWNLGDPLATIQKLQTIFPVNYSIYYTEDEANEGYAESVSILTYIDARDFGTWAATYNNIIDPGDRSDDYERYKQEKADQLLHKIAERFPEIIQFKRSTKIATPLTYRDYQGSGTGSLYGILKDVHHHAATSFSTKTRIPNLYLTGQNVNLHGVLGVAMTAIVTASEFVGMDDMIRKIT
ncbi:MAG: NAD(P)/FAD-dependent oxidoreductase [Sphingobacteriales bacterium]|nr:MAG: NAD(P)/FAD-dependent oxidoreductase [Sphingobacteriales bacterium]